MPADNQQNNNTDKRPPHRFKKGNKWAWKPGQSGNLKGCPSYAARFREQLEKAMEDVANEKNMSLPESIVRRAFSDPQLAKALLSKFLADQLKVEGNMTLKDLAAKLGVNDGDEEPES